MSKKTIPFIVLALLVIAAGVLCLDRVKPKSFSELVPEADSPTVVCVVNNIDKGEFRLEGESYQDFIKELKACSYYYDGRHEETYKGDLYHVEFIDINTNKLLDSVIISDEPMLYIGKKQYRIKVQTDADIAYRGKNAVITKSQIEQTTDFYVQSGDSREIAEEKAVQYMKEYEALYQAAVEMGYTATDDEVRAYIEELKAAAETSENKEEIEKAMSQFETEEAYWEYEFTVYQKSLPIQKYVKALEKDFLKSDSTGSWEERFEEIKKELVEKEEFSKDLKQFN